MGFGGLGGVVVEEGFLSGGDLGSVDGGYDGGGGQVVGGYTVAGAVSDIVGAQNLTMGVNVAEATDLVAMGILKSGTFCFYLICKYTIFTTSRLFFTT